MTSLPQDTRRGLHLLALAGFVLLLTILLPHRAAASVIIQRPLYIGLTNGLVGYWSFDGGTVFNRGGGVLDQSGNNNNGTLTNGATTTIGKIGQALAFDGANDLVTVTNPTAINNIQAKTISAWIYPRSLGELNFGTVVISGSNQWYIQMCNSDGSECPSSANSFVFMNQPLGGGGSRNEWYAPANTIKLNQWQHIAVTYVCGNTNALLYHNGQQLPIAKSLTDAATCADDTGVDKTIGSTPAADATFNGQIDDVRIYNRALSAAEIQRLYKIGGTMTINKPGNSGSLTNGLVGYWTFDGGTVFSKGNKALDLSGQGNHGTITNGATTTIGKIGQALQFDGVNDYVNVGTGASIGDLAAKTISAWIYPRTLGLGDSGDILISLNTLPPHYVLKLCDTDSTCPSIVSTAIFYVRDVTTPGIWRFPANTIVLNQWQHIAVSYVCATANDPVFYYNGIQVATTEVQAPTDVVCDDSAQQKTIGAYPDGSDETFNGKIDDVRIYNRVLSADEIKRLYKIGGTFTVNKAQDPSLTSLGTGLVGYWSFDGPSLMPSLTTASSTTGTSTPASNAAVNGRGDNNGFQVSVGGGSLAEADSVKGLRDDDSGTGVTTDGCSTTPQNEADYHEFSNFDFSIPAGAWISGIEVELTATTSTGTGTNLLCTALSWNGGTSTTTAKSSGDIPIATTTIKLGGPTDTWGHAWSTSGTNELSNSKFRLYIMPDSSGAATVDYWLDKVIARVYYTASTTKDNIAIDASGQGNNGTLTNGPTKAIGKIGQALSFDGVDDYVNIGTSFDIASLPFSISAWINITNYNFHSIFSKRDTFSATDERFSFEISTSATCSSNGNLNLSAGSGGTSLCSSYIVPLNQWVHVSIVVSSGRTDLYVNGQFQENMGSFTLGTDSAAATRIGANDTSVTDFMAGKLDEVRVYNRALTAQEIKRLYNMGYPN